MNLVEALRMALRSIVANKMRASLTMLGIIIGVTAVITLVSVGNGAQASITDRIKSLGSDVLQIQAGRREQGRVTMALGSANTLTLEDARAIANPRNVPSVVAVAPQVMTFGQVVAGGKNLNTRIQGVTAEYADMFDWDVTQGEFIGKYHDDVQARVAVLGTTTANNLFPGQDPLGKTVRINDTPFVVIGVLESKGAFMMVDTDDVVMVPVSTAKAYLSQTRTPRGERVINSISAKVIDEQHLQAAQDEITTLLRQRHRLAKSESDDFVITTQTEMVQTVGQVIGIMTILLGCIAGISLLVGGIGIMNIMLVSVTERTREIGIRKAVGAKRRDILTQFLIEAAVLCLSGGMVGVLLGWGASQLFSGLNLGFRALFSLDAVILAFTISAAIGIFFGLYPAARAARLHPIEALRYE